MVGNGLAKVRRYRSSATVEMERMVLNTDDYKIAMRIGVECIHCCT